MLTALIAEDELLVRLGISSCVPWTEMDIAVIGEAADGQEAWELYQKYRPDIIILDILMPGLNGIELLKRVRGQDQHCAVIIVTNIDKDDTLNEIKRLGISDILVKMSMKRNDIVTAVSRACASLRTTSNVTPAEMMTEKREWEQFLFESDCDNAPFEAQGITAIRLIPDKQMTHVLQDSLSALLLQRLGRPEAYVIISRENCQIFIWKEKAVKIHSEKILRDFARYIQDNFHTVLNVVSFFDILPGARLPFMVRRSVSLLQDRRLFDYPVLILDANGEYYDERLDTLRNSLSMNLPICADKAEFMMLKTRLDRYPGVLEEGFDRVLGNAVPLLRELGLSETQPGLWEMTNHICKSVEQRMDQVVRKVRPEIRRVMGYIQTHLTEELTLGELSKFANYSSIYLSKLFKAEVGMSYTDYLFQTRMLRAQELLRKTDDPISEISAICGFSDFSYFCARFRQFFGMTPREWRKRKSETSV